MRRDQRPIDGHVMGDLAVARDPHPCDLCGIPTANVRQDLATGQVDDDICDACLQEHYPGVHW